MKIYRNILLLVFTLFAQLTLAQSKQGEFDTTRVFLYRGKPMLYMPPVPPAGTALKFTISRAIGDTARKFVLLTNPTMAKSFEAFKKIVGEGIIDSLKQQKKLNSDDDLWDFLKKDQDFKDYGLLGINVNFLRAMGFVFVDEGLKELKPGTPVYYHISVTEPDAHVIKAKFIAGTSVAFSRAVVYSSRVKDSIALVKWGYINKPVNDMPVSANVYRRAEGENDFTELKEKAGIFVHGDSVLFKIRDKIKPGLLYNYFIRLSDIFDNESYATSDTLKMLAVDYANLPKVMGVTAKDTIGGVYVSWKPLTAIALVSGIEIQRSKSIAAGYINLGTVAPTQTAFIDNQAVNAQTYYYRVHTLGLNNNISLIYSGFVSATHLDKNPPSAPYNVTATTYAKGVMVKWGTVKGAYGYYIYRSASSTGTKVETISRMLKDTATSFLDTTKNRSRRTDYYYMVKAVNAANTESPFSGKAVAKLPVGLDKIMIPGGLRLEPQNGKMLIEWDDARKNDAYIAGYNVYKRVADSKAVVFDGNTPAAIEAKKLNFVKINGNPVNVPLFEDNSLPDTLKFDYAISSVDAYGVESGLSAIASSSYFNTAVIVKPPVQVYVRKVLGGVEIRWVPVNSKVPNSFAIYRRRAGEKDMSKIATVKDGLQTYTDKTVVASTMYIYLIKAIADNKESAASAEKAVKLD